MKKIAVIHPFLFAIIPVLFLFSHNINEVTYVEILVPLAITLCFTLLLTITARLVIKNHEKAGIIISLFLILFFSYGRMYTALENFQSETLSIYRFRYLFPILSIPVIFCIYWILKTNKNLTSLTKALNNMSFFLAALSLLNIGIYEYQTKNVLKEGDTIEIQKNNNIIANKGITSPDIYYIILDGYARSSTLKEIYGYDNTKFTGYLEKKGFYIGTKSFSNYAMTFLSLASSLNMEYINYLTEKEGIHSLDRKLAYKMIKNNRVMNFLKSKKYKFIHLGSGWDATNNNQYADIEFQNFGRWNGFSIALIKTTLLRPFVDHFSLFENDARERVLSTFSKLAEVHQIKGPKFIFAHILCPHEPYVFGPKGVPVQPKAGETAIEQKEKYLNQLMFINQKVIVLINEILSKSTTSPIVLLQADHGSASTFATPMEIGWANPSDTSLKERMRIFSAYHLPDDGNALLYDSISPANSFKLIFNHYFDTDYSLLNDRSYYSTYQQPYKFTDVTGKVK